MPPGCPQGTRGDRATKPDDAKLRPLTKPGWRFDGSGLPLEMTATDATPQPSIGCRQAIDAVRGHPVATSAARTDVAAMKGRPSSTKLPARPSGEIAGHPAPVVPKRSTSRASTMGVPPARGGVSQICGDGRAPTASPSSGGADACRSRRPAARCPRWVHTRGRGLRSRAPAAEREAEARVRPGIGARAAILAQAQLDGAVGRVAACLHSRLRLPVGLPARRAGHAQQEIARLVQPHEQSLPSPHRRQGPQAGTHVGP